MKKIAKILAMFAVFALAFSFAGCKSDDSDSSDDDVTISGGSTSGNGSSNGSSSGSNTSGGNSGNTSDNTSGGSSSGGSDTGDSSGSGSESGSTTGGSESGTTGGTTSGSIEPIPEGFVKIPAASISGSETWTPSSNVFVSGRKLEIASFYMSDHEVTRGEYKSVMGSDPSTAKAYDKDRKELKGDDAKNNPVNNINWYDALVYCNTRSIKEKLTPCYLISGSTNPDDWGSVPTSWNHTWDATCDFTANGYRLPTEAEWEWAARGGEDYTYAGSNTIGEVAWWLNNTYGTNDVKTKKANGYGLYDMSGNVWEWCWDRFYGKILSNTPNSGSVSGSKRIRRGGSWLYQEGTAQVANRIGEDPYERRKDYSDLGFRVVRAAK